GDDRGGRPRGVATGGDLRGGREPAQQRAACVLRDDPDRPLVDLHPAADRARTADPLPRAGSGRRADRVARAVRRGGGGADVVIASSERLAERIAGVASDRKARDIRVLDVGSLVGYTDYFLICRAGRSGRRRRSTTRFIRR